MTDRLPSNVPIAAADSSVPKGWVGVPEGALIRTADHWFSFFRSPPTWVLGTYYTSDAYVNPGRQSYIRPSSWRARLSVAIPVIRKLWSRWKGKRL